jgi:hypothetical protein
VPTPTYTALATVTLASTASSVTFSSIPATYRDLIVVMNVGGATAASSRMRFNADSGNNYNWVFMNGSGSSTTSSSQSNQNNLDVGAFIGLSATVGPYNLIAQIMDYSATDKHKTVLSRVNLTSDLYPGTTALAGRWASTSAITTVQLFPDSATNWIAGSRFDLYGVIA